MSLHFTEWDCRTEVPNRAKLRQLRQSKVPLRLISIRQQSW